VKKKTISRGDGGKRWRDKTLSKKKIRSARRGKMGIRVLRGVDTGAAGKFTTSNVSKAKEKSKTGGNFSEGVGRLLGGWGDTGGKTWITGRVGAGAGGRPLVKKRWKRRAKKCWGRQV